MRGNPPKPKVCTCKLRAVKSIAGLEYSAKL